MAEELETPAHVLRLIQFVALHLAQHDGRGASAGTRNTTGEISTSPPLVETALNTHVTKMVAASSVMSQDPVGLPGGSIILFTGSACLNQGKTALARAAHTLLMGNQIAHYDKPGPTAS